MDFAHAAFSRDDGDGGIKPHVATHACETCRGRKVKCDEERPRCGVCQRLNAHCDYREAKPTKKDNTLLHILNSLRTLEIKIDRLGSQQAQLQEQSRENYPSITARLGREDVLGQRRHGLGRAIESASISTDESRPLAMNLQFSPVSPLTPASMQYERHVPARKITAWPAVKASLRDVLVDTLSWDSEIDAGEMWLTKISNEFEMPLPNDESVDFVFVTGNPAHAWETGTVCMTKGMVETFCQAFFRSFHPIYPILDPRHFYAVTLPRAYSCSFDQSDGCSTLVLLVLALGAVATDGFSGNQILEELTGRETGIRGGTSQQPPGLALLNQAKKRLGAILSQYDVITLQCFILLSVYYSQCSRNMDYWRMTSLSCSLCQNIVRTVYDWKTFDSDLISRCYWMCTLLEGGLTSELGLNPSGITDLENSVPLPLFFTDSPSEIPNSQDDNFVQSHFLAHVALRSLLNRINTSSNSSQYPLPNDGPDDKAQKTLVMELTRQLYSWREHLPSMINWDDENLDLDIKTPNTPTSWPSLVDFRVVLNASLRTRFKYAQYLIWRPYLYKVLHFPQSSTEDDFHGCQEAFKACSMWPLTYPVFQDQRRLIPHIYEYSHTFFGVLLLLHSSLANQGLRDCLGSFDEREDLELSQAYMLRWMRDMQVVHPVARWCWRFLKAAYKDHPVVEQRI